jgi:hypothetical protein
MIDYYEFLQISSQAEPETIHRVYRYLAGRFHPDNPESGDSNLFCLVKSAYDVLSDPVKRAEYDLIRKSAPVEQEPLSSSVDFMDDLDGELNRRLAVLAVLYRRRRMNADVPEVTLAEIETGMGFPRDYLNFTLWYLARKGYVSRADNAQFTLTADGVDFVETHRGSIPILNKMLTTGSAFPSSKTVPAQDAQPVGDAERVNRQASVRATPARPGPIPIVLPKEFVPAPEWRPGMPDRRVNKEDRRAGSRKRRSTD